MKKLYKIPTISLVVIMFIGFTGCGYSFVSMRGELPADVRTIYIPPFDNLTEEPDMGFILATALTRVFIESGFYVTSHRDEADAELIGVVKSVSYYSRVYDEEDIAILVSVGVTAEMMLMRIDGEILWEANNVYKNDDYNVGGGGVVLDINKGKALEELAEELASEVHDRILLGY